jgi:hypothetical protein
VDQGRESKGASVIKPGSLLVVWQTSNPQQHPHTADSQAYLQLPCLFYLLPVPPAAARQPGEGPLLLQLLPPGPRKPLLLLLLPVLFTALPALPLPRLLLLLLLLE